MPLKHGNVKPDIQAMKRVMATACGQAFCRARQFDCHMLLESWVAAQKSHACSAPEQGG
jgi:hypothetical protein